jgi:hypothetical protein
LHQKLVIKRGRTFVSFTAPQKLVQYENSIDDFLLMTTMTNIMNLTLQSNQSMKNKLNFSGRLRTITTL